jgi:hypothetical protein
MLVNVLLVTLCVSLGLLLLFILYRKTIQYVNRGIPQLKNYCVLYPVEKNPASGEVAIYFTTEMSREVVLDLLDEDLILLKNLFTDNVDNGGQIVRFDSREVPNGHYYYCLTTENQKTMKKLTILN